MNVADRSGKTALIYASIYGRVETVKTLIKEGRTNVNWADKSGKTALMYASESYKKDSLDIVNALKREGKADLNLVDNNKKTALILAIDRWTT